MTKVVIYGGTLEGRRLTEILADNNIDVSVCVATAYGGTLLPDRANVHVYVERMDEDRMVEFLSELGPDYCIDATHPYAELVTKNVYAACGRCQVKYIRVERDKRDLFDTEIVYTGSVDEAASHLNKTTGKIFISTGSKKLDKYTIIDDYKNRCVARVLPTTEVMDKCEKLGFCGKNLICMQGPFSEELNYQMFKMTDADILVTKNTGHAGGFDEKCEAAIRLGMRIVVVGRPKESVGRSYTPAQVLDMIIGHRTRKIYLIGMGAGDFNLLTGEALKAINDSDVLIGAKRVLEIYKGYENKPHLIEYKPEVIKSYIDSHEEYNNFALLYSGDIGFYSGAAAFSDCDMEVVPISGISSPVYLMNKLKIAWQDACMVSNHGKTTTLIPLIRDNRYVCSLLGAKRQVADTCEKLLQYGMNDVEVIVGERLSYEDECITKGLPSDMVNREFDSLSVALFINNNTRNYKLPGLSDKEFIRGKAPMTKQEVRTIAVAKLGLDCNSVVYDVGAGTGSISIEAALIANKGIVYAIEKKEEAVELINKNKQKFAADNIEIISGNAPEVLSELATPTHVFIGGSSGRLLDIIEAVRNKNKNVRFVVDCVTMETLSDLIRVTEIYPEYKDMDIVCVGISKSHVLGSYHMMTAENSVYIASF